MLNTAQTHSSVVSVIFLLYCMLQSKELKIDTHHAVCRRWLYDLHIQ